MLYHPGGSHSLPVKIRPSDRKKVKGLTNVIISNYSNVLSNVIISNQTGTQTERKEKRMTEQKKNQNHVSK